MVTLEDLEGERRLLRAVLEDALRILDRAARNPRQRHRRPTREVVEWILRDEAERPFSFVNVCEALDVDASALRRRLIPLLEVVFPTTCTVIPLRRFSRPEVGFPEEDGGERPGGRASQGGRS